MQDEIVELLDVASGEQFDLEELVPLKIERNPLLRLLSPNDNDENDKLHFEPPSVKQSPLLRQLMKHPEDYKDDFLDLPKEMESSLLVLLKEGGISDLKLKELQESNFEEFPGLKELFLVRNKNEMQKRIFTLLTASPKRSARLFAQLFEYNNRVEKQTTINEIILMIKRDPK